MSDEIATFIEQAWDDHAGNAAGVATRIEAALPRLAQTPARIAEFLQLAEHVLVGHRADADAMERCVIALGPLAADDAARDALSRARLGASLLRGDAAPPAGLPRAAVIRAHGSAVCGLAARGDAEEARRRWQAAAALARETTNDDRAALKAYAACCHNLAAALEEQRPRTAALDTLMMDAARESCSAWSEAGTWLQVERADYMLSRCAAAVGDATRAHAHAQSCLALCEAHGAEPVERFFAHEAIARAHLVGGDCDAARAQWTEMHALLDAIADDGLRAWAQDAFDTLGRSLSA